MKLIRCLITIGIANSVNQIASFYVPVQNGDGAGGGGGDDDEDETFFSPCF